VGAGSPFGAFEQEDNGRCERRSLPHGYLKVN
jgi:hypothetical protein